MADRIRALLQRFLDWWKQFPIRRKALLISLIAVVIIALGILGYTVSRPVWILIATAEDANQSVTIRNLLSGEGIEYQVSDDGLKYSIKKEDESTTRILLGSNDIPSPGYTIDDALGGGFSATEADKKRKMQVYYEAQLVKDLESVKNVRSARVNLNLPDNDGTLIAKQLPAYAGIVLDLKDTMDTDQAAGLAKYVAVTLGNGTTENINIIDTNGNVLFSGGDETSSAGVVSSNQKAKEQAEKLAVAKVKNVLAGSSNGSIYDNIEVGINLAMNFNSTDYVDYDYYVHEGQTQGYLDSRSESKTSATNGVAGVPGTDANDDTTYVLPDNEYSQSSSSDVTEDYLPSERITTSKGEVGTISYEDSTITVVAYNYVPYNEDEMRATGQLDDMTFAEFMVENAGNVQTEVPEDVVAAVSRATRIPVENISILAYDVPMFNASEGGRDWTDYLQIILAVVIIVMLLLVVLRTLKKEEEEEVEEEVSVDELLEETQEMDLEAVRYSEKSEARIMIEKFVEERPEAVASLLRNWLNEEWGD